jgi:hypothetical protein
VIDPQKLRKVVKKMGRSEVLPSNELDRVLKLPRRVWDRDPDLDEFVDMTTRYLKTPTGTQRLWPLQAKALQDLHDMGGLYGPIPVGAGKTLISFLAPTVVESQRPLLVVPAKLRAKTVREFQALAKHWQTHMGLHIVSYEKLSRINGTKLLQHYRPDLLIFDESHRLKNRSAAVTRKISQWMQAFPNTKVLAMTGTSTKRSLIDFAHILYWTLPNCFPLPRNIEELESWACAVDEIKVFENRRSTAPGALLALCDNTEKLQGQSGVRNALRRRIHETPGVVSLSSVQLDASLNIEVALETGYGNEVRRLARQLREGILPNGDVYLEEGKEAQALQTKWRIMRTLTSGFWYEWDPRPPADWLELRAAWRKTVRNILFKNVPGLESEALIARAASAGKINRAVEELYKEWRAKRDKHKWSTVPVWVDDTILRRVEKWSKEHTGLIWVSEVALGERLERDLGLSYFREQGCNKAGRPVEDTSPKKDGCVVLSVQANGEGRNLQAWNDNLVISPPPTGTVWEQLLGRTHREGQLAEEVWVDVVIGCETEWKCWGQALRDSKFHEDFEGQKRLNLATVDYKFKSTPLDDEGLWGEGSIRAE